VAKLVQDLLKVDKKDNRAASLHCVSHNVFRVDLMPIENHVLVVVLFVMPPRDGKRNTVFRENRVKRSARCG
jgi:hypothetical protein